tara:strand:+ start:1500 stop:2075 length:576 start_codon:yes stop_codon:yes gene_type:complete
MGFREARNFLLEMNQAASKLDRELQTLQADSMRRGTASPAKQAVGMAPTENEQKERILRVMDCYQIGADDEEKRMEIMDAMYAELIQPSIHSEEEEKEEVSKPHEHYVHPGRTVSEFQGPFDQVQIMAMPLSNRAKNALVNAGYQRASDLFGLKLTDLLAVPKMGRKTAEEIFTHYRQKNHVHFTGRLGKN